MKYSISKAASKLSKYVPFINYDKNVNEAYSVSEKSFKTKHKNLYKALLISPLVAPLVFLSADNIINNTALLYTHQHPSQHTIKLPENTQVRNVANNNEFTVAIYDINFSKTEKTELTKDYLQNRLQKAFKGYGPFGLDLDVNVIYEQFNPENALKEQFESYVSKNIMAKDELNSEHIKKVLEIYPKEFENFIKNQQISSGLSKPSKNVIINGQGTTSLNSEMENYLRNILGSENYTASITKDEPDSNFIVVLADFKDDGYVNGSAHNHNPINLRHGIGYSFIDKNINGNKFSKESLSRVITHELGHNLGIPHAAFSHDVMSYSLTYPLLTKKIPGLSFSHQSKDKWKEIKNRYTDEIDKIENFSENDLLPSQQIENNSIEQSLENILKQLPELDTPVYRRSFVEQFESK